MTKYLNKEKLAAGRRNESRKKSAGNFFTSKAKDKNGNDSEMFFEKFAGQEIAVVGTDVIPKNGEIDSYNVVCFDNGAVMSTSRFFTARGLRWPVGGNSAKWDYVNACIINETPLKVVPERVTVAKGKTKENKEFEVATYHFQEVLLPKTELSVLEEEKGE